MGFLFTEAVMTHVQAESDCSSLKWNDVFDSLPYVKFLKAFFCVRFLFNLLSFVFRVGRYGCRLAPQFCGNPDLIACHIVIHSS